VKAVVVASGDADPRDADRLADAELVVAADGGAGWLDAVGHRPDLLVGDLDSADPELVARLAAAGTVIERHAADKDATDAELAVASAVAAGADSVLMLGALAGARLDHEMANLLMLGDPRWQDQLQDLRIVRGGTTVRALRGAGTLELELPVGGIVTLLPLGGGASGVTTGGLRYPLRGEALRLGRSRGVSNLVERLPASVSAEDGMLLVIEIATQGDEQ
jgi:thiamine pyrophosphokinase